MKLRTCYAHCMHLAGNTHEWQWNEYVRIAALTQYLGPYSANATYGKMLSRETLLRYHQAGEALTLAASLGAFGTATL